jgi:hypothetical protein
MCPAIYKKISQSNGINIANNLGNRVASFNIYAYNATSILGIDYLICIFIMKKVV